MDDASSVRNTDRSTGGQTDGRLQDRGEGGGVDGWGEQGRGYRGNAFGV